MPVPSMVKERAPETPDDGVSALGEPDPGGTVLRGLEVLMISTILFVGAVAWLAVVGLCVFGVIALFVSAPVPSLLVALVVVLVIAALAALKANGTIPRRRTLG